MKTLQISNETYQRVQKLLEEGNFKTELSTIDSLVIDALRTSSISSKGLLVFDDESIFGSKSCNQETWDKKFNAQEEEFKGKRQANMADYLAISGMNEPALLASVQKSARQSVVLAQTRIIHNARIIDNNLSGKVVHNQGITIPGAKEITISLDVIPHLKEVVLADLDEHGLNYARALMNNMKASKSQLFKAYTELCGRDADKIPFRTEAKNLRIYNPEMFVGFGIYGDMVCVYGDNHDYVRGQSRGVLAVPKQTFQRKSKKPIGTKS